MDPEKRDSNGPAAQVEFDEEEQQNPSAAENVSQLAILINRAGSRVFSQKFMKVFTIH